MGRGKPIFFFSLEHGKLREECSISPVILSEAKKLGKAITGSF